MRVCPNCGTTEQDDFMAVVNDTYPDEDGTMIEARVGCKKCDMEWTAYEHMTVDKPVVIYDLKKWTVNER